MNIVAAKSIAFFSRKNSRGQNVCYHYETKKRCKMKVREFLNNEKDEKRINEYLTTLNLRLLNNGSSRRYKHYIITDIDNNEYVFNERVNYYTEKSKIW